MADHNESQEPTPVPVPPPAPRPEDTVAGMPVSDEKAKNQIPGFQIIEKIGAGAMASVFKARQLSLDRIVAIKVLPQSLSADAEYVERFYQEGQVAAKLNHPNIVQAYDVGEAHGYHYFVMEYVEGRTVYDDLKDGKVYSEAEALDIIIQIARALEHAHAAGLIHRDVKPKNIMLTQGGIAKLMDMGLARIADDAQAAAAESGRLFGTPYYVSPEQIIGKSDVDFRCDHYSLGATLYHMVTGTVPFEGETAKDVMIKHVKEKLTPADHHNLDLSFGLVKVINKMMSKHRQDRHETTMALREELESIDFLLQVDEPRSGELSGLATLAERAPKTPDVQPPPTVIAPAQPDKKRPQARTNPMNLLLVILLGVSMAINVILMVLMALKE